MKKLTPQEKQAVKVLNFIARYDGIIQCEDDIILLLQHGIEKFISKKHRDLVLINRNVYPIRITIKKK